MPVGRLSFAVTTDASGNGTATSIPSNGLIYEVRVPLAGTAMLGAGATATVALTRGFDGGTVASFSSCAANIQRAVGLGLYTNSGGTTAYALGIGPVVSPGVPFNGTVTCTVTGAQPSKSGTVYAYYQR